MRKHFIALLVLVVALALSVSPVQAQTILTNTTLSAAVALSDTNISLTSATGVSAPVTSDPTKRTWLYVDRELMSVTAVSGTYVSVIRGYGSTAAAAHASSAFVFVVPAYLMPGTALPQGSCTRASQTVLPLIQFTTGLISDCNGGQLVTGDARQTTRLSGGTLNLPDMGGTAYSALESNGTAFGATTSMYCTELKLPYSKVLTGLKVLMGTTAGGTEKKLVVLYDAGGKVLANSAVAGQTMGSTASVFVAVPFLASFYAAGPATYFGCVQSNGTSDTIRHTVTGTNDNALAGAVTGQTFGTVVNATMPSTFTSAAGPYFALY